MTALGRFLPDATGCYWPVAACRDRLFLGAQASKSVQMAGQMSAIAYWQKQQTAPSVRKLFAPMT